jgi:hypothetical protein
MDDLQKLGLRVSTHAPACHKHAPACKRGSIRMHPSTLAKLCPLIQSLQALQRKLLNNDLGHHTWPEAEQGNPQGSNPATQTAPPPAPRTPQGLPKRACCPPSRRHPVPARQAPRCGSAPLPQPAHALVPQSSRQNSNPATQTAPPPAPRTPQGLPKRACCPLQVAATALPQPARRRDVGQHPSPSQPTPLSPRVANKTRILRLRPPPHRLPARLTASPRGPVASC